MASWLLWKCMEKRIHTSPGDFGNTPALAERLDPEADHPRSIRTGKRDRWDHAY